LRNTDPSIPTIRFRTCRADLSIRGVDITTAQPERDGYFDAGSGQKSRQGTERLLMCVGETDQIGLVQKAHPRRRHLGALNIAHRVRDDDITPKQRRC
jgi:hypothetical protein